MASHRSLIITIQSTLYGNLFYHYTMLYGSPTLHKALPVDTDISVALRVKRWVQRYQSCVCDMQLSSYVREPRNANDMNQTLRAHVNALSSAFTEEKFQPTRRLNLGIMLSVPMKKRRRSWDNRRPESWTRTRRPIAKWTVNHYT
jgi:hypothetical protein